MELLNRFFPNHKRKIYTKLLQSASTSDIYEHVLRSKVDTTPPDYRQGHSGLFTFCANVSERSDGAKGVTTADLRHLRCLVRAQSGAQEGRQLH